MHESVLAVTLRYMSTDTAARAASIADDIASNNAPLVDAIDVKLAVADYTEYHPLPEYLEDAVYALLVARLPR